LPGPHERSQRAAPPEGRWQLTRGWSAVRWVSGSIHDIFVVHMATRRAGGRLRSTRDE
jgi:hypothetical protein